MQPTAVLFSNFNFVSLSLVTNLLEKQCRVIVITEEESRWREEVKLLAGSQSFEVGQTVNNLEVSFIFIVEGFGATEGAKKRLDKAFDFLRSKAEKKSSIILPFTQNSSLEKALVKSVRDFISVHNLATKIIFTGDIYGPRMDFVDKSIVGRILKDTIVKKEVNLPADDCELYPVFVDDFSKEVVRLTLSYSDEVNQFFVAQKDSVYSFFQKLQEIKPHTQFVKDYSFVVPQPVENIEFAVPKTSDSKGLEKTLNWIETHKINEPSVKKENREVVKTPFLRPTRKIKVKKKYWLTALVVLGIWLFLSPLIAIFISTASLGIAYRRFQKNDIGSATNFIKISKISANIANDELSIINGFPYTVSSLLVRVTDVAAKSIESLENLQKIPQGVLGNQDYDLEDLSGQLSVELDSLYSEVSLIQAEVQSLPNISKNFLPVDAGFLTDGRYYLAAARDITRRLPALLGTDVGRTYLVLFQNNMELRPTGGFIGSFALITFGHGKLVDITVMDVYAADGQLKGFVEPPSPIKNYLGEATWYLRDANWDPDFVISAQKVEWFLDKELDRSVDGVVGIDLEVVRDILEVTGPIEIADYNQKVNSKNLYERVQYEVEANFFPGSQRKTSFLTALTRSLLDRLTNLDSTSYAAVGSVILTNLKEKHIQVFVHDLPSANIFSTFGWDGSLNIPTCRAATNCDEMWFGHNEANVGVNKANYFVQRSMSASSVITSTAFKNSLTINLNNNANPNLGVKGKYKSYVRLLVPKNVKIEKVEISDLSGTKTVDPEITENIHTKEAGVLVEVNPGSNKKIVYRWEQSTSLNFTASGEVLFKWIDQAGTSDELVSMQFVKPGNINLSSSPSFSLTQGTIVGYNTLLAGDFVSRIFW